MLLDDSNFLYYYHPTTVAVKCDNNKPDSVLKGTYIDPTLCEHIFKLLFIQASHSYTRVTIINHIYLKPIFLNSPVFSVTIPELCIKATSTSQDFTVESSLPSLSLCNMSCYGDNGIVVLGMFPSEMTIIPGDGPP